MSVSRWWVGRHKADLAVAVTRLPTEGLHRTFTHSVFTVAVILAVFYLIGAMYLLSLFLAFGVTIRVKKTIEVSA